MILLKFLLCLSTSLLLYGLSLRLIDEGEAKDKIDYFAYAAAITILIPVPWIVGFIIL